MEKLGLDEDRPEPKKGFWRRQFQKDSTKKQKIFDWIFGVVLPVACVFFDPIVFKGGLGGTAFLGTYKPFAYILSFVSIMAMMAWLIWGAKLKWLNAFLAGLFFVGGIVSLGVGIILSPFSIIGMFLLIGFLGFTPLFSSIVYLRNSLRAYQSAEAFLEKRVLANSFFLIWITVIPSVTNLEINKALDAMIRGDAQTVRSKARTLKYVAPLVNFDRLLRAYPTGADAASAEKRAAIAEVYLQFSNGDLDGKLRGIQD
jgi:hypothetical protein